MDKKIIAVMEATGHQGGALIRAIVNDPESEFKARAITRNISEAKATALVNSPQVEVVEADEEDVDSLVNAFQGAYGVYCVTFYWEYFSPEKELNHAANLAKAVERSGVKHVIWSSLEDTRNWIPLDDDRMPTLMEKYKVPHFDT